ncbi:MAG: C40 family peptidase [Actinobacteria bacterium]|nr:C40 family peptidase [Actinomycetota bacterium]
MVLAGLLVLSISPFVSAQPLDQQKSEAQQEVQQLQQKVEDAVERYNYACYKLNETKSHIETNQADIETAEAQLAASKGRLNKRARAMYMSRQSTMLDVMVNSNSFDEFLVGVEFSKKIAQKDADVVAQVKQARAELEAAKQALAQQKSEQEAARAEIASSKAEVEKQLAGAKGKLAGVEDQIRQAMVARQRDSSYSSSSSRRSSPVAAIPGVTSPPPGAPNTGVVGVAYAQLGKPYVWGGGGPNSFDCSGLVQYCYRNGAGISLPHSSYAQANCGARVSAGQLQPGDIIGFRGWGHVGIYVGGGQYIHAPHSGDVVRVASLASRGNFCGAVRP